MADLPTIVIEAGLSESPAKLKCDANWWLVQPGRNGGKVMIVVTISINLKDKSFQIEKWENAPAPARPNTRVNPPQTHTNRLRFRRWYNRLLSGQMLLSYHTKWGYWSARSPAFWENIFVPASSTTNRLYICRKWITGFCNWFLGWRKVAMGKY
jgi:hypothetical protein